MSKSFIVAVLLLSALSGHSLIASAAVGRIDGSFAVSSTGAANYSIPIGAPPGVNGIQPHLSLVYSSQSGMGIAGMGWSLAGLSSISRCNRTIAQDGTLGQVTLTGSDVYCMDGSRLRVTAGNYGDDGSTYQTEIANFSLVTAHGSAGN